MANVFEINGDVGGDIIDLAIRQGVFRSELSESEMKRNAYRDMLLTRKAKKNKRETSANCIFRY